MIELNNVSYKYQNGYTAIKNACLDIKSGEITLVIGKNGSGKSTLLSLISKLYKYTGDIYLDNEDIKKINNKKFRQNLGIVFQNPNTQIIFPSVYDNFKFVMNNLGLDDSDDLIKESLSIVSMEEFMYENPYNLSLGQKQRIALATVLITKPKYLLLDEVTSMIDSEGKKGIYNLLIKLKNSGIGIIMGTNILEEIIYADKIVVLDKEIKEVLSKDELFKNIDILKKYGFDIPLTIKIISKLYNKIDFNNYNEDIILEYINE